MSKKTIIYLLIALSSLMQLSCSKSNDKDLLNQRVNELVNLIESHKEQNIKEYLSEDFSVASKFNKTQFSQFVRYHLGRNKNISISLINKEIIFNGVTADITADALLLGAEGWLPERGQRYSVESRWKKERGDWVMSRLRWNVK